QSTENGHVRPGRKARSAKTVGKKGHEKGRGDGGKECVGVPLRQSSGDISHHKPADASQEAGREAAFIEGGEPRSPQKVANINAGHRILPPGGFGLLEEPQGLLRLRPSEAETTAESGELLYSVQVIAVL